MLSITVFTFLPSTLDHPNSCFIQINNQFRIKKLYLWVQIHTHTINNAMNNLLSRTHSHTTFKKGSEKNRKICHKNWNEYDSKGINKIKIKTTQFKCLYKFFPYSFFHQNNVRHSFLAKSFQFGSWNTKQNRRWLFLRNINMLIKPSLARSLSLSVSLSVSLSLSGCLSFPYCLINDLFPILSSQHQN